MKIRYIPYIARLVFVGGGPPMRGDSFTFVVALLRRLWLATVPLPCRRQQRLLSASSRLAEHATDGTDQFRGNIKRRVALLSTLINYNCHYYRRADNILLPTRLKTSLHKI